MVDHVQTMVETWSRYVVDHISNINVKWPPLSEHGLLGKDLVISPGK